MLKKKILCIALSVATAATVMVAPVGFNNIESANAATKLVNPGDLIRTNTFESGRGLPWNVVETAPSTDRFEIKDGGYKITVTNITDKTQDSRWSVQFRHRGLNLQAGHTYNVSFTVKADHNCKIYPKIGDMGDPYNEYWNGEGTINNGGKTWQPIQLYAGQTKTVTGSFRMDQNVSKCEFAFHLAGDCAPDNVNPEDGSEYSYTFTNISVKDAQYPGTTVEYDDTDYAVKTNQVGYFTTAEKKATAVLQNTTPVGWKLVNSAGQTVKSGMTTVYGNDSASGDNVHKIDFSDYNVKGTGYKIVLDSAAKTVPQHNDEVDEDINVLTESPEFEIGDNLYSKMKYDAIKYFYHNRSGIPIEAKYTDGRDDLARPAGHVSDKLQCTPYEYDNKTASWYNESYTLDVTGGWYDAGDHGKYVVNGGISTWTMQNQYERALNAGEDMTQTPFADGTMNIPESGNGNPDILDESRYNVEVLLKMQVPDGYKYAGMVHHKAHDDTWTGLAIRPDQDPKERHLQPPSTAATLNMAAVAAQASRLWKDLDPTFSNKCLAAAKKAYAAAQKYPNIYAPITGGTGGGAYGDNKVTDEFYWAACELYATTGDESYLSDAKANENYLSMPTELNGGEDTGVSGCFDWGNVEGLGTLSLLASKNNLPSSELQKAKDNVTKAADVFVNNQENQGYGTTITESQTVKGVKGYPWGSNSFVMNTMILLGYANDINGGTKYINSANRAMDYLLGDNANTKCYVTGYGTKQLENPHHRFWAYQCDNTFPKAPAGVVSGGPNSGLEDPWVQGSGWQPGSRPAAKCYMDNIESWSTNECTINWNAPFAWVTSYLDDHNNENNSDPSYGDINGDGTIDVSDYTLFRKYFNAGGENGNVKIVKDNADVNEDGVVNFFDLVALKAKL